MSTLDLYFQRCFLRRIPHIHQALKEVVVTHYYLKRVAVYGLSIIPQRPFRD